MQVRRYVFSNRSAADTVAYGLKVAGVATDGPYPSPDWQSTDLFAYVEDGQQADADLAATHGRPRLAAVENLDSTGPVASAVRRRRQELDLGSASDDPLTAVQTGVRVTLSDGSAVHLAEGRTFEVRQTENLHVHRGTRRVGVFVAGAWRYAERTFARGDTDAAPAIEPPDDAASE